MPPRKAAAAAGDPAQEPVELDATKYDVVVDLKGLVAVPQNFETDGVQTIRAFRFAKGAAVHVPNSPGQYLTSQPFRALLLPMYVNFLEQFSRARELAIAFVDPETSGATERQGVLIVSYMLPLKGKSGQKGPSRDQYRISAIGDVASLAVIPADDHKQLCPHFGDLKAPLVQDFGIKKPSDSAKLVGAWKLVDRVDSLFDNAHSGIEATAEEMRRENTRAGDAFAVANKGKLAKLKSALERSGPERYDQPVNKRILVLELGQEPDEDEPVFLLSPVRMALRDRNAELQRTQLRRLLPACAEEGTGSEAAAAAAGDAAGVGSEAAAGEAAAGEAEAGEAAAGEAGAGEAAAGEAEEEEEEGEGWREEEHGLGLNADEIPDGDDDDDDDDDDDAGPKLPARGPSARPRKTTDHFEAGPARGCGGKGARGGVGQSRGRGKGRHAGQPPPAAPQGLQPPRRYELSEFICMKL